MAAKPEGRTCEGHIRAQHRLSRHGQRSGATHHQTGIADLSTYSGRDRSRGLTQGVTT